jgi:L-threonylcarbamoyladenylate synthase
VTISVDDGQIREAVSLLKRGGLIAFPTETYYGLGVDPFNPKALQRLFQVKQRTSDKPVLVLVFDQSQLSLLAASIPAHFDRLTRAFWPGPLTLVYPALPTLSTMLTGGTGTIGIRQSPHPVTRRLLEKWQRPVTATSANHSGALPATTATEVEEIFGSAVDLVVNGGPTPGGQGSTLVGENKDVFCIREGKIPFTEILAVL